MTTSTLHPLRADERDLLTTAVAAGAALGALDLALQLTMPYPWADLANSSAVWALCAFAFALWARTTPARAARAGAVLLAVAVEVYYLAAILLDRAGPASLVSPVTVRWLMAAVVAGVVFGVAGTWARDRDPWRSATGLAAVSAVFLSEAVVRLRPALGGGLGDLGALSTVLMLLALGVAVLLSALGRPAHLARAVLVLVPLVVAGAAAFTLAGY